MRSLATTEINTHLRIPKFRSPVGTIEPARLTLQARIICIRGVEVEIGCPPTRLPKLRHDLLNRNLEGAIQPVVQW